MKVAVVGSGASGLAAAFYLLKSGHEVEVFESSPDLGGRIGSSQLGNVEIDFGGKNIGRSYTLFREFAEFFQGGEFEEFGINTSELVDGKIVPINREKTIVAIINLFKMVGAKDFFKLFYYILKIKQNPELGFLNSAFFNALSDKYDSQPASKFFGHSFNDRVLRPMSVRMNAAEPDEVYLGNLGSNIKMIADKYDQLSGGMGPLLRNFKSKVSCKFSHKLIKIEGHKLKSKKLTFEVDGRLVSQEFDAVVLALSATRAAGFFDEANPEMSRFLREIRYYPVAVGIAKYKQDIFSPDIRALVFPANSALSNAGAYGKSDLDLIRYTFSGRAARKYLHEKASPDSLIALAESELNPHFKVNSELRENYLFKVIPEGLCSYSPFHHRTLSGIQAGLKTMNGIALVGDYIRGASIEACFKSAAEGVQRLNEVLQ